MRRDFFAFFVAVFFIFNLNSQCVSWIQEDFDSFEYASICPFLISGTVMHMSPQGAAYGGPSYSGSSHLYLNFVNNFTGVVFSRPYPVCVGGSYQISFYHREALGGTNNTTFNIYDANNVLLSSENVPWSGNLWNHYVSPSILATTPSLRLEIVNNQATGNNDMVIDDMSIAICGVQEQLNYTFCSQQTPLDLYNLFSSNMPSGGVWSGPSSLSNGGAGTFDPTSNSLGVYSYSAPGQGCIQPSAITVDGILPIDIGNDTTICFGSSVTYDAGAGFNYYHWSTGDTTQTITVDQPGVYNVETGMAMGNLVQNGDFEGGTSTAANHFTTMYTAGTGGPWGLLSNPGEWAITTAANLVHNNFPACTDHTTGATNFFCANGADVSNTTVWSQTVPISQNTDYIFSFWAMRVSDDPSLSDLQLLVNGSPIGPVNTTGSTCTWLQFSTIWNSGAAVSAVLSIVCQSNSGSGNDFALDDIVFAPLCISSDTVVVNVETSAQTITVSDPTCHGFLDGQIDVVNNLASEYSIDGGVTWQADSSFINLPAGNYDVCSRTALGCSLCDSVILVDQVIVTVEADSNTVICENGSVDISATASGGASFDYHWNFTSDLSQTQTVSPTNDSLFYVFAENENGCISELDSIAVSLHPPLNGSITSDVSICPGTSITIEAVAMGGMGAPYTYTWSNGAVNTVALVDSIVVTPTETTNYTVTISDACETTPVDFGMEVGIYPLPVPQFDIINAPQCEPATFKLLNTTDTILCKSVIWTVDGDQVFVHQDTVLAGEYAAGNYDVNMLVMTYDGCIDSIFFPEVLEVKPSPIADFTFSPNPVKMFETEVHFQNSSVGEQFYHWHFTEGEPSTSSEEFPSVEFPKGEVGTYPVMLVVESDLDCFDTIYREVKVHTDVIVYAPNTFTPDGDDLNQYWRVYIDGIDTYDFELIVYNRWGQKVWENRDPNDGWDGSYNGHFVEDGTYLWIIHTKDFLTDEHYKFTGHLNIIR